MGLVAPGPPGFTGRAREESETREGFELPAIDVSSSRKVFAHPCTGGGSGRVCGVQGTTVGTVPPWRTRRAGVVGNGRMSAHARGGHSDLLAIAGHISELIGRYRNLSELYRPFVGCPSRRYGRSKHSHRTGRCERLLRACHRGLNRHARRCCGRRLAIPGYLVRRYFCRRLFGLSGIVRSMSPASSAGLR